MYVSVLFFSVLIDLSIIFLFDKKQCSVNVSITHVAGWLYGTLRFTVWIGVVLYGVLRTTGTMCNYNIRGNHTSWYQFMYSVLRAPCSMHICTKGIGFHENRMIDFAADPRATVWGTDPACLYYLVPVLLYICIPILIHRKGSPFFFVSLASHF